MQGVTKVCSWFMRKKSTIQIITSQNKLVHTLTKIGKITALGVCQNSVGLEYIFLSYSNFSGVKKYEQQ